MYFWCLLLSPVTWRFIQFRWYFFILLVTLITFWGVFSTYPARNNFAFRIIVYPSHFLRWIISRSTVRSFPKINIVFPLLYFLTCPNIIIVSFTLTCCLCFISSCCFIFWFGFSSLFFQKMRYRKITTRSCFFLTLFTNVLLTNL